MGTRCSARCRGSSARIWTALIRKRQTSWGGSFARLLENTAEDSRSALENALGGLVRVAVVVVLTAAGRGFSAAAGGGCRCMD